MSFSMFLIQQCQISAGPHGPIFIKVFVFFRGVSNSSQKVIKLHAHSIVAQVVAATSNTGTFGYLNIIRTALYHKTNII